MQNLTILDLWTYRDGSDLGSNVVDTHADITGFGVEAVDGSIGKVDEATYDVGRSYIVVDTGPWIFGKKVMIPAGVVRGIDETEELVFVNRTKEADQERARVGRVARRRLRTAAISERTTGLAGPATATGTTTSSSCGVTDRAGDARRPGIATATRPPTHPSGIRSGRRACAGGIRRSGGVSGSLGRPDARRCRRRQLTLDVGRIDAARSSKSSSFASMRSLLSLDSLEPL